MRLGYACISMELSKRGITCSKTVRIETIKTTGEGVLNELAINNIEALKQTIEYNESIGIRFFRITSGLFPHLENPAVDKLLGHTRNIEFAKDKLNEVGNLARGYGHRLTFHPDHFIQLGSPRKEVVMQSIRDLKLHAEIFKYMGYTPALGSVMILHGGGAYNDKLGALKRWEETFLELDKSVRDFIALENDEFTFSIEDLLPLCEKHMIPLCIDFFHHEVMTGSNIVNENILNRVINIWKNRGIKPKCHWSNQRKGARNGTHSDYINDIPAHIIQFCNKYGVDIMCECKMKEKCAMKLLKKYYNRNVIGGKVMWVYRN